MRLIAVAFALALMSSAQAVPLAPLHQVEGVSARKSPTGAERAGHESVVSAWPEPPSGRPAGPSVGALPE